MSQQKKQARRPQSTPRRRRRRAGVPTLLTVVLLVIALGVGMLAGFALARRSDPSKKALTASQARTGELEQFLMTLGYNVTQESPETWSLASDDDALAAITSETPADDGDVSVWDDQNVLQGTLSEDQEPVVVAEFEGGQVLSSEVIPVYNDELTSYIFDGMNAEDISATLLQDVLTRQVGEKLKQVDAAKQGLDTLTAEEEAAAKTEASAEFEESVLTAQDELVSTAGMSAEDIRAAAIDYLKENSGITLESLEAEAIQEKKEEKYRAFVVKDVTVTDEEVQTYYDEKVAEQKADFDAVPDDFVYSHLYSSLVVYNPEGFRAVRDILIPFDSADDSSTAEDLTTQLAAIDVVNQADNYQALSEQLNELYAPLETKAQEVVDKLNAGEDFGALMDAYGTSDYLKDEPLRSQGYYLNSDTFVNSDEYVQGAMELERPGQVSVPVRSTLGVHLIQYIGEVTPGAIPLEQVRDAVRDDLLETRQDEYYEDYVNDLLSNTNVTYYTDRLQ